MYFVKIGRGLFRLIEIPVSVVFKDIKAVTLTPMLFLTCPGRTYDLDKSLELQPMHL